MLDPHWRAVARRRLGVAPILVGGLAIIIAVAGTALAILDLVRQREAARLSLADKGRLLAETLNDSLADSLYFGQVEQARHSLEVLATLPEVEDYQLFALDGRLLAGAGLEKYPRGTVAPAIAAAARSGGAVHRIGDGIEVVRPIAAGSEALAALRIRLGPGPLAPTFRKQFLRYLGEGIVVVLLAAGLAFALGSWRTTAGALAESEARLRQLAGGMQEALWMSELASGQLLYLSPSFEQIWGIDCAEALAKPEARLAVVHPDDRERVRRSQRGEAGEQVVEEYRIERRDGSERWIRERIFVIVDNNGNPYRVVGAAEDVTEPKRLELERLQAHRLESLGRLAGGVAHDFNNLLTVIFGSVQLAQSRLPPESPARNQIEQIAQAAQRGAVLTHQLLSFARSQPAQPQAIRIPQLLERTDGMLRRLIGEEIELATETAPELWAVSAGPGQLDQVLLNLAVNARDAMPRGGRLSISAANLKIRRGEVGSPSGLAPGDYVLLTVSDTGAGIRADLLQQVFEPFFTTKPAGKGTGLGLSICYGIIKQNGGQITVTSFPGQGTTFHVYLPRAEGYSGSAPAAVAGSFLPTGSETILLAEDDSAVRGVAAAALRGQGYRVLEASNGEEALAIAARESGEIQLLLTDQIMPGMRGSALAEELTQRRPGLKVLLVSGYQSGGPEIPNGADFLAKPFSPDDLARRVRKLLDEVRTEEVRHA